MHAGDLVHPAGFFQDANQVPLQIHQHGLILAKRIEPGITITAVKGEQAVRRTPCALHGNVPVTVKGLAGVEWRVWVDIQGNLFCTRSQE